MDIIFFALGAACLALGVLAAASALASRIGTPLPIVLGCAGLGYGAAVSQFEMSLAGFALDPYEMWFVQNIAFDSNAMLYLFLPPLLFEMALSVQVRRMLENASIVLAMAVVAVIASTVAVGLAVHAASAFTVAPLGLIACLMLGAAVATTDPSAVVTTFRELGAPRRLLVILEGESLLNDAAAIALFALLLGAISGAGAFGPAAFLLDFLWSFCGGAAVGLGLAAVAGRVYALLARSVFAETSLTVALAYGSYLAADGLLGVSGVVAVVCAGLATGSSGFVRMGPRNWLSVQVIWAQIGYWASGLILLIIASLTPGLIGALTLKQVALASVVYVAALGARAVMLFLFLPPIERLTSVEPISSPQKALILWGGVRGAVTLVLALSLTETAALGADAPIVGAVAALYTLSTLFLNAATLAWTTRMLGLDRLSAADEALRRLIISGTHAKVRRKVAQLVSERSLDETALGELDAAFAQQRRDAEMEAREAPERIPFGERLRLGLTILCGQEARLIRRAFEEGAIGPRATILLRLTAERLADGARTGGRHGYEEAVEGTLQAGGDYWLAFLLHRTLRIDAPLRSAIEFRLTTLLESERILRELDQFDELTLKPMVGPEAAGNLRSALAARLRRVQAEIASLARQYPNYAAALERTLVLRAGLRGERREYDRLYNDGVIDLDVLNTLQTDLDRRETVLGRPPRLDLAQTPLELLRRSAFFEELSAAQQERVAERLQILFARPGEVIARRGARRTQMYFVVSGVLERRGEGLREPLSNGDAFGFTALLFPGRRRETDVVSLGFSRLLTLSVGDFKALAESDSALGAKLRARITQAVFEEPKARRAG